MIASCVPASLLFTGTEQRVLDPVDKVVFPEVMAERRRTQTHFHRHHGT
jgi:hypothetical protein